jgi:hypothetical protein
LHFPVIRRFYIIKSFMIPHKINYNFILFTGPIILLSHFEMLNRIILHWSTAQTLKFLHRTQTAPDKNVLAISHRCRAAASENPVENFQVAAAPNALEETTGIYKHVYFFCDVICREITAAIVRYRFVGNRNYPTVQSGRF